MPRVPGRAGRVYVGRDLHARAGTRVQLQFTAAIALTTCILTVIDLLALLA